MSSFDALYQKNVSVFGAEPSPSLRKHLHRLDPNTIVLDVGAGQGRNSLFLARRGFSVHAIDPSATGLEQLAQQAHQEGLKVTTYQRTLEEHPQTLNSYGTVLLLGLLPLLTRPEAAALAAHTTELLQPGGILLVTAFTTRDPRFQTFRRASEEASLEGPPPALRFLYLEPPELPTLFPELALVHFWEGLGPEHRHGEGPLEHHGLAEAVLQKGGETVGKDSDGAAGLIQTGSGSSR